MCFCVRANQSMFRGSESNAKFFFFKKEKKSKDFLDRLRSAEVAAAIKRGFFREQSKLCEFTISFKVIPPGKKAKN